MKINAYLLAADPAWIEASVLSYYDRVDRIVVSYDQDARGWTGVEINVAECLARLRAIDRDGKLDFRPGHFSGKEFPRQPMAGETFQRQTSIDQASTDADWVLQLDSDEVVGDSDRFCQCLHNASNSGAEALDYPSRWLYKRVGDGIYLEQCRRGWRVSASYPGPIAVRAHTRLRFARQGPERRYRVDFSPRNTDPSYPRDATVNEAVALDQGIAHFSWTRSQAVMDAKAINSGHAHDFDWKPLLANWRRAGKHPLWAAVMSQRERGNRKRHLRLSKVSLPRDVIERLPTGFDLATGELLLAALPTTSRQPIDLPRESSKAAFEQQAVTT